MPSRDFAQNVAAGNSWVVPAKGTTKVNARQKRILLAAKAGGIAIQKAADAAGIARNTATKVLRDPGTREIFREIVASLDAELQGLAELILKTLAADLVSAQNESSRARLRGEALTTMAHLRQLGNFGMTPTAGSGEGGASAMTLGDILVRVSTSQSYSANAAPTVGGTTFHD